VIAGGGVAAAEAALALHELAGSLVELVIVAPDSEFSYRPLSVNEPFGYARTRRYPLAELAAEAGAQLVAAEFGWVDPDGRIAYTAAGDPLPYGALLLAVGAHAKPAFAHVATIDDRRMDEVLSGLVSDLEQGYVKRLAFVAPARVAWPLPLYELALMSAARAYDMGVEVAITLITPEPQPLAVFGDAAAAAVRALLDDAAIEAICGTAASVVEAGRIELQPGGRTVRADRIVALPELFGPAIRGLPAGKSGFIPVDRDGGVRGAERIWAAGDAIESIVKHGGLAAQQADVAAAAIATLAGARVERPPDPELHGILLTGRRPRYISARLTGTRGYTSQITDEPTWEPVAKISARHLAPYLERRDALG